MSITKLDLRTEPKQMRARDRVEVILAVTENLLATGKKVTTSNIAREAGIPIGSVYRYFPDIYAIYRQLFENINGDMLTKVKTELTKDDPASSWKQSFDRCMEIMRNTYKTNPAFGVLLLLTESPDLQASKTKAREDVASALAARWRIGRDEFSGDDPDIIARTVIELATSNELRYFLEPDQETRDRLYTEGSRAISAYLDLYLKH